MEGSNRVQTKALLQFIEDAPTAFHAVDAVKKQLTSNGFSELREGDPWNLTIGKGYFVTRNRSSVIAFRIPTQAPQGFLISASHTDSPMFKLKSEALVPAFGEYLRLNTEVYGGTILSSWVDRPLTLAGRVVLRDGDVFKTETVHFDRDLLLIPGVAIHLNRNVNAGYAYNPAVDMLPLFAQTNAKEDLLRELLAKELSCDADMIVSWDLYVVSNTKGSIWGIDGEFFSAPRIDNLMCVYGTLAGFCQADAPSSMLTVFYAADNEETGSATKQGAGSVFLSDVLDRICEALRVDRRRLLASSLMVSADNGHAKHPNHPELSDAQNAPNLNGGVVIKYNAAQKYTTDGVSAALFSEICRRANVPVQTYANRSDMPGGSTLGSISNTQVPLTTVDIGMAQLAMHSAYETAGSDDPAYLIAAMKAFYESTITTQGDGIFRLASKEG